MALSSEEIMNIQKTANIVDIIGSYVSLEKKGKNYFCICPFHDDHNPSMCVNEQRQLYTCFVCHATGNVFNFVQNYENISFIEAVKVVADKIGVTLSEGYKTVSKYEKHYEATELALKFYQNNLKSKDGSYARAYLKERGLSDETIQEFGIGYAPRENDALSKLLINKGYDENLLMSIGLSSKGNVLYDLFRDRITFPIHNASGRAVGFSARIFYESDDAKYINTKETVIFKKGEILFNYHRAQTEARRLKYIVVVEGQMDAIRIYESGIKNVVATMGTALTMEHVKLLKKLNVKVVLCMDSDNAGEKATVTNGELLEQNDVDLAILRLSGTKDPDEYILKYGIEAFNTAVSNAVSYFDFKLNYLKKDKNLNKVDDVTNYINQVIAELNKTKDDVLINLTINKLSEDYGIDRNILLNKVIKVEPKKTKVIEHQEREKLKKNQRLSEILLYYLMNEEKYIKLYEQELSYIPDETYMNIAQDILAFFIKYNYINIADFITYEINSDYYTNVLNIIDKYANMELNDGDFIGIIDKIKTWINEKKIMELKNRLKVVTDMNEKLSITDEIAKLKKGCVNQ